MMQVFIKGGSIIKFLRQKYRKPYCVYTVFRRMQVKNRRKRFFDDERLFVHLRPKFNRCRHYLLIKKSGIFHCL